MPRGRADPTMMGSMGCLALVVAAAAHPAAIACADDASTTWSDLRPVFERAGMLQLHKLASAPERFLDELGRACMTAALQHLSARFVRAFEAGGPSKDQISGDDVREALASVPPTVRGLRDVAEALSRCESGEDGGATTRALDDGSFLQKHKRARALWQLAAREGH